MKYYSDGAAQELSFNDDSIDVDFRIESDSQTHAFNLDSGTTGVTASAVSRVLIDRIAGADSYTFTLQGNSSTASTVTFTIADSNDITAAKDAINAVSGSTGIIASMKEGDKSKIELVNDAKLSYEKLTPDWFGYLRIG